MSELIRANRVSVNVQDEVLTATFHRTHNKLKTIKQPETGFIPNEEDNKVAQKEEFRKYVMAHAKDFGISYEPADARLDINKRSPKYTNDEILSDDAIAMVTPDIDKFMEACNVEDLELKEIQVDEITPMEKSPKGADLLKIGIENGKYQNGNWAWATVRIIVTVGYGDDEGYVTMECSLVSGQLKKPTKIEELGYTQTGFKTALFPQLGIELKKEESTQQDNQVNDEDDEEEDLTLDVD